MVQSNTGLNLFARVKKKKFIFPFGRTNTNLYESRSLLLFLKTITGNQNLRNGKRAACNHGVMDARGRLLSTKEA